MSKSSSCNKDFILLLKHNGLSFQTCDGCRTDDKKYKDTHKDAKEQRKEYDIYYRELNKDMMRPKKTRPGEKTKKFGKVSFRGRPETHQSWSAAKKPQPGKKTKKFGKVSFRGSPETHTELEGGQKTPE